MVNDKFEIDKSRIVVSEDEYNQIIRRLATEIVNYYTNLNVKEIIVFGLLDGCLMVMPDITRKLYPFIKLQCGTMKVTRYGTGNTEGKEEPSIKFDINKNIKDQYILILDDCGDKLTTLDFVVRFLMLKEPKQIDICVLVNKPMNNLKNVNIKLTFIGKNIGPDFVAGCGMDDLDGTGRNVPFIYKVIM